MAKPYLSNREISELNRAFQMMGGERLGELPSHMSVHLTRTAVQVEEAYEPISDRITELRKKHAKKDGSGNPSRDEDGNVEIDPDQRGKFDDEMDRMLDEKGDTVHVMQIPLTIFSDKVDPVFKAQTILLKRGILYVPESEGEEEDYQGPEVREPEDLMDKESDEEGPEDTDGGSPEEAES